MRRARGFTLVEVLIALMIVTIGLAALMGVVSGTSRGSGHLRDKTLAQWIALNRLTEVRLNVNKFGQNTDTGELVYAGRTWHYDTRYFDTSIASMKRVVVRVYQGDSKTKGNPVAEAMSFQGTALNAPGSTNVEWNPPALPAGTPGASGTPANPTNPGNLGNPGTGTPGSRLNQPGAGGQPPLQ